MEDVTITQAQYAFFIDKIDVKILHAREIKYSDLPKGVIYLGSEMAAYGDWSYYLMPDGEVVATYFSIGD